MREIIRKSIVPLYGMAAAWVLYCIIFPLYKTWHFILLACTGVISYIVLSVFFPGKTEYIEIPKEPVTTGDSSIDNLLREGENAVAELRSLESRIEDGAVKGKLEEIIIITEKIFQNLIDDPSDYRQVKRFADFHLPTVIKLMHSYDRFGKSGAGGENITATLKRIESVLDTISDSYKKFYDSLFENQALDIETDIIVLENLLKKEGFPGKDFG